MQKYSIITIGTFDGVHKGHQHLISNLIELSKILNLDPIILTLPMPASFYLSKSNFIGSLTTTFEKVNLLKQWVPNVELMEFAKIRNIKAKNFIDDYLIEKYAMKAIVVGYDFKFGKDREGDFEFLKQHSNGRYKVFESTKYEINGETVSSSIVRKLLKDGNIKKANFFLGRNYFINGVVVRGMRLARKIGFPTANIRFDPYKIVPKLGVYSVDAVVNDIVYPSIGYISERKSNGAFYKNIEVHMFDMDENIYSKPIKIIFKDFVREPMKFSTIEQTRAQILRDIEFIKSNE